MIHKILCSDIYFHRAKYTKRCHVNVPVETLYSNYICVFTDPYLQKDRIVQ